MSEKTMAVEYAVDKQPGALTDFDVQLDLLDKSLSMLHDRIAPVCNQYATIHAGSQDSEPRAEPASQLRGRVERLSNLIRALDRITETVDL